MADCDGFVVNVLGPAGPTRTGVSYVTRDFFKALGVQPVMGRSFAPDDAHPGAAPVVLVSARYWKQYLGSARQVSALNLRIEDRIYSVAGILPEQFEFPAKTDLWVLSELDPGNPSRTSHNFSAIGRLRPGVSVTQASTDNAAMVGSTSSQRSPTKGGSLLRSAAAVSMQESMTGRVSSLLCIPAGSGRFFAAGRLRQRCQFPARTGVEARTPTGNPQRAWRRTRKADRAG